MNTFIAIFTPIYLRNHKLLDMLLEFDKYISEPRLVGNSIYVVIHIV